MPHDIHLSFEMVSESLIDKGLHGVCHERSMSQLPPLRPMASIAAKKSGYIEWLCNISQIGIYVALNAKTKQKQIDKTAENSSNIRRKNHYIQQLLLLQSKCFALSG